MILLLALLSFTANSTSVDNSWVCKGINVEGGIVDIKDITFNTGMSCVDESYSFTTDDSGAFLLVHLLNLVKNDNLTLYIFNPDGSVYDTVEEIVLENLSTGTYMSYVIPIHGQSVMLGTYDARLLSNGAVIASKSFTVSEPDYDCSNNGFFCCPSDRMCLSKADSKYTCTSGTCCNSALSCVNQVDGELTVKIVTDCVAEGLSECEKIIGNVYDYSIHGGMESQPTIEFFYRDIDVDCYNKNNVVIAVYNEANTTNGTSAWRIFESTITKVAENYYSISAKIDYIGYMAVFKSPKCVPTDCFIPGFSTVPFNGQVMVNNPIKLGVCQIARLCDASAEGICDNKCTQGLDPDCGSMVCTSQMNDCCNPEKDDTCDLDCALGMDPDCADESYLDGLCYPSSSQKRGFSECDVHCTGADSACSSGSGCNPAADDTCDRNCPKLSNGVGYLDVDCCTSKGIAITNAAGDCCNTDEDSVCDPDCIAGLDPDCNKEITGQSGSLEAVEIVNSCTMPKVPSSSDINFQSGVVYTTSGGKELMMDIAWPKTNGPHPLVVLIHGGGWIIGDRTSLDNTAKLLAGQGYVAATIDYRLTTGSTSRFPAAVEDIRCAVKWLKQSEQTSQYSIDPSRVAALGSSAGAHLAAMIGTASDVAGLDGTCPISGSPKVKAVLGYSGAYDLRDLNQIGRGSQFISIFLGQGYLPDTAELASPIVHVDNSDPPHLLLHSTSDAMVFITQPRSMEAELQAAGVPATIVETPGQHGEPAPFSPAYPTATCTALKFLSEQLQP